MQPTRQHPSQTPTHAHNQRALATVVVGGARERQRFLRGRDNGRQGGLIRAEKSADQKLKNPRRWLRVQCVCMRA